MINNIRVRCSTEDKLFPFIRKHYVNQMFGHLECAAFLLGVQMCPIANMLLLTLINEVNWHPYFLLINEL